jgi:transketolase
MNYEMIELRKKIGDILCEMGEANHKIYVLDSDLAKSTTSIKFKEKFPDRFIETGIAETSAMSIATGIASEGQIPFYVNFATFISGTAWTQLRQAAYANANVKMIATHPGMDNGPDGASHHANEDIALVRAIPNVKLLIPSNVKELRQAIEIAINYNGPVYIRCARDVVPDVELNQDVKIGKAIVVDDQGDDFAIVYEGTATTVAYKGYEKLKEKGYKGKLINIFSVKPIDIELVNKLASTVEVIVTVENHSIIGGLGGAISEILAQNPQHAKLRMVGVQDMFTESGKAVDIKTKYGITAENIIEKVETAIIK